MTIKIYDNYIENCGAGISAPSDADIDIQGNRFFSCGKAIDFRAPESLLGYLGLRPDTPLSKLREILSFMSASRRTESEITAKAESSGFSKWILAAGNTTTFVQGLVALYQHLPNILAMLPR